jgi:LysM repeat protein
MSERHGPRDWRDRNGGRSPSGFTHRRRAPTTRPSFRHPAHGTQVRRDMGYGPYVIGFIVVVAALAAFLYVGLNWATGPGRVASMAVQPTPTSIAAIQPPEAPAPAPASPLADQIYVVKAGDTPAAIARQFSIRTDELLAANNIDDPRKLQIGQSLKIPTSAQ